MQRIVADRPTSGLNGRALAALSGRLSETNSEPRPIDTGVAPLLRICPAQGREFLLARAETRRIAAGEIFSSLTDDCTAVWFVQRGIIDVQYPHPCADERLSGRILREGDAYGSHAIDGPATHSVWLTALTDVELLEVPAEALRKARQHVPGVETWIEHVLKPQSVRRLLAQLATRMPGEETILLDFAASLEGQSHEIGEVVQQAGEPVEALRLVESGSIIAASAREGGDGDRGPRTLMPGSLVAGGALLLQTASPSTFRAAEPTTLRTLPVGVLADYFARSDTMRNALAELVLLGHDACSASTAAVVTDRSYVDDAPQRDGEDVEIGPDAPRPPWWRATPFIHQREEKDCGAACLRMIHAYHGQHLDYRSSRQLARVSRYGTSLLDLAEAAERLGYVASGVQVDGWDALRSVRLPAIAHVDKNHFVVVWRVTSRRAQVSDPSLRKMWISKEEFLKQFEGVLLLVRPTDALVRGPEPQQAQPTRPPKWRDFSPARLWQFVRPHRGLLMSVVFASLLLQGFGIVTPLLTQVLIDRVIGHGETGMLNVIFAGVLCLTVFQGIVTFSRSYLMIQTSIQIERTLLEAVYQRVVSMAHSFFSRFTTGDLVRRFQEVDTVKNFFAENAVSMLLDLTMLITYSAVLLYLQPALAGVFLAILSLNAVAVLLIARPVRGHALSFMQKFAKVNTHVIDTFKGIDPVKAMAMERPFARAFSALMSPTLDHSRRLSYWALACGITVQVLDGVNHAVLLWRGALLVLAGALTLGQMMAFLMLAGQLTAPFLRLLGQWAELQRTIISLYRVGDLLEETPEADQQEGRGALLSPPRIRGEIRFQDVSFRYGDDPKDATRYALDALDLAIQPGEVVGIVGRSGCGKSTLARLLLRFHEPNHGRVLIDGIHLRDLDARALRRQIGLVTQDAVLYSGTIRDNIVCGRDDVSEEDMVRAAQAAGAYDFISELPYGFETLIGEQGLRLSGGQNQRIVIARALCTNPRILIFDEATAALDPIVEQEIHERLREIIRGRTTIIIAHRLHTLRRADRIVVLDRGRLVEQGSHDELMELGGLYRRMFIASPDWHAAQAMVA